MIVLLDDLAYSDLGCYGSEINTPNFDTLAEQGIRFTGYRSGTMCAPSRAMLISGNDNHIEGMGMMMSRRAEHKKYKGQPFYEEDISNRIIAFPRLLQQAGYNTYMSGKWHLGWEDSSDPIYHGFDNTFALRNSFANYYNAINYGISDAEGRDTISKYTVNGKVVDYQDGAYVTEVFTDKIKESIEKGLKTDPDKPFMAYLPYTAPHWPLQVDEKFVKPYYGKYDSGYQALIESRFKKMQEKGVIDSIFQLPDYSTHLPDWNSLENKEKLRESRKMEVYAGMVSNVDYHFGRLVSFLKDQGEYDNTIFFILSDNGAGAESFAKHHIMGSVVNDTITNATSNIGRPNSFTSIGKNWAQTLSVPFRKFKGFMYEGGIRTPFILKGIGQEKNAIKHDFVTVQDIAPTVLAIAGAKYPNLTFQLRGRNLLPYFENGLPFPNDFTYAMEHRSRGMLQKGNFKIVNNKDASNEEMFELYDLSVDPFERNDISSTQVEVKKMLLGEWQNFEDEVHVLYLKNETK